MILPGHVAGLAPDTRVPMYTLVGWAATTAVVAAIAAPLHLEPIHQTTIIRHALQGKRSFYTI